ncbi:MAG TPA: anthranilate synthase component I family protein [Phycisphaerae bacterium]|nr:anthranilate synthase component I family protein [Phycisphaerae bacterium]
MNRASAIPTFDLRAAVRPVPWPRDPETVFASVAERRDAVWLDSAAGPASLARWSVLSAEPSAVLVHQGDATRLLAADGRVLLTVPRDPFAALGQALAAVRIEDDPAAEALPFGPGFYGYLAYDLGVYVEPKAGLARTRDIALPDLWLGLYETVLVLDHAQDRAYVVGAEGPAADALAAALEGAAATPTDAPLPDRRDPGDLACNFSREAYLAAVERAREYIAAGDIFQVNLSRRFTVARQERADRPGHAYQRPSDLYRRLRRFNPAPYAAYVGLGQGRAVLSSSPELFLDLGADGRVVTRPIKGTRPRREGDDAFNRRMADDLMAAEKDRAELVMIVDLERNDLGRVCAYGSVRVTEPRALEAYAAVFHTAATVEGRLHPGRDVVDLVRATFPGGSITGAPKVRAMQIIAELEPTRRSVYTGAVGYLAPPTPARPAGRCALNIAIRTLLTAGPNVHLQVGGGIVADSDPAAEFDETTDKARAMLAALGLPT